MTSHQARVEWTRNDAAFVDRRYARAHRWTFDGGAVVPASASPHVVRPPWSDPAGVDPEEAYVAALASCHMLWFLDLAAQAGFVVDAYRDEAEGVMGTNADGREWVERVVLSPQVAFAGDRRPDGAAVADLHRRAHEHCYLANSVRTDIVVQGSWRVVQ